ncbi:2'-5' RNA ligase family protein [Ruminococcaceae bacterium OttesenSCG-928-A16]|nr:2'-5' RNA ligase family protein [Ruminococcaceae bacterium OttesenSCG-928-A16]
METSYLSIMASFDEETNARIEALKVAACQVQNSCSILASHLSLGFYVGLAPQILANWAARFAATQPPLPVYFTSVSAFGNRVCYLAPKTNQALLGFHRALHTQYDDFAGEVGHPYTLKSGQWVPHCTLFMSDTEDVTPALAAARQQFTPFSGTITAITLGHFGPVATLGQYPLQGTPPAP